MKPKTQRLWIILFCILSLACALGFILRAFQENLLFFYTPSDLLNKNFQENQRIRLGGIVKPLSVKLHAKEHKIEFTVTDETHDVHINYKGILPDLFRERQGIIVEGYLIDKSHFNAISVLAKHDENYMPPQVEKALRGKGLHIKI
ncbi:MAG: cytochrome c maturation protein CcmE [Alphaproteobacteria bacterium]|nr:cytochrome c maturation protein CcmE [Alphaproteobacteria bacterium]